MDARGLDARAAPRIGRIRGPRASTFLIDRYLIREYLMFLGFGLGMGAVLFIVVDLLQTLDRFLRIKPAFSLIVQHLAYNLPSELYKGLPLIVLIATVFLFLSLTRQRELDALKAAGISLYRVSFPILLTAAAISIAAVIFQEAALPELNAKAEEVDNVKIRGRIPATCSDRARSGTARRTRGSSGWRSSIRWISPWTACCSSRSTRTSGS